MTLSYFYVTATIFNLFFFTLLYLFFPTLRETFTAEDSFMENLSAIFAFEGFLFGLFFLRQKKQKVSKYFYISPIFAIILFLDELSFGERIFNFKFPRIKGVKIDSIHDFISLFWELTKDIIQEARLFNPFVFIISFLIIIFFVSFFLLKIYKRLDLQSVFISIPKHPSFLFLAIALIFLVIASILDLHIFNFRGMVFLEELFEMNATLSILFSCISIRNAPPTKHRAN